MRFIHTADWHLGRIFHGVHLTDDQSYILDQFVALVRESKADAVLIAGDIYDRAVPPLEAVSLLDETLIRLVSDLKVPVILSSGNHDSADRLGFASRLLEENGLYIIGSLKKATTPILFEDDHGPIQIFALPYAEPSLVREKLDETNISDHNSALNALIARIHDRMSSKLRSILMAHTFVAGSESSESERPLSIGGSGAVEPAIFRDFNYVALGHLHRPQQPGSRMHYAGSLLKYSFSEADHTKSVNLIEMNAAGDYYMERIALTPRRNVRCIDGYLRDILENAHSDPDREDYVWVTLRDTGALLDPMGKMREVYPNILHIERPGLTGASEPGEATRDHRVMSDLDLFAGFFLQVTSRDLTPEERDAYAQSVNQLRRIEREADE